MESLQTLISKLRAPRTAQAHVILCNDSVRFVVIGTALAAEEKLIELYSADKERKHRYALLNQHQKYEDQYFWHIQTVSYDIMLGGLTK